MVAATTREVEIRMKYVLDKASLDEARKTGREAVGIQESIRKATEQGAAGAVRAQKKANDEMERERMKYWTAEARRIDKNLKERERAEKQIAKAAEQSAAAVAAAYNRQQAALRNALGGVTQLGKGFIQLGLVGEENMEKIVNGLVRAEAAANLIKGGMQAVDSLNKFSAARSVIAGAGGSAASGAAGSALGTAGAGVAGGAVAAGLGTLTAAALAAAASLGVIVTVAKEYAQGTHDKPGSFWMRSATFSANADQWLRNTIPGARMLFGDRYENDERTRLEARTAAMERQRRSNLGAFAIAEEHERAARDRSGQQAELRGLSVASLVARAAAQGFGSRDQQQIQVGSAQSAASTASARLAAADQNASSLESTLARLRNESAAATLKAAQEERNLAQIIHEENQIKLNEARQSRDAHAAALSAAESRYAAERRSYQSFQERFLELDPAKQRQAAEAARIAQSGGELSDFQRGVLRESNFGSINERVQQGFDADTQRRFDALGVGDLTRSFREGMERMQAGIEAEREEALDFIKNVNEIGKLFRDGHQKLREAVAKAAAEQVEAYKAGIEDARVQTETNRRIRENSGR